MRVLRFIKEIFKKYPRLFIVNTVLIIFVGAIEACSLFTVGPLVDFLIHPDLKGISPVTQKIMKIMDSLGIPVSLSSYLILFIVFILLSSGLRIFARHSILRTKYALCQDLIVGTFDDFFNSRWYFFSSERQGVLLNTFSRELTVVGDAFGAMGYSFAALWQLIFYLAVPFYISWQVTLISFITAFLLSCPFALIGRISYHLGKLSTVTANELISIIQENISLAKVILGFGNQKKSIEGVDSAFNLHRKATLQSQTLALSIPVLYHPLGVVVLAVALFSARKFGVPISEMAILLLALLQSVIAIGDLASRKNSLDNFFPSYEQVKNLRLRARELRQGSGERIFTGFTHEILLDMVSFSYPGHEELVLKDINIRIPKGKMVAFVGESGAGKSTLIDMLMGFNEPLKGRITFDSVDFKAFDIISYRKRIGYVPQESVLFNMTIRDNLLWANEKASDREIKYACKQANACEFIDRFPKGYDTYVGDRGMRLSGGQRQRIALARAILRQPEILFLDEATSSLDTQSERLIQHAIENIAKETTIIVIAHRLSTIVNADYVYVLKQGYIVEEGMYSDLVKMDGQFNRMVRLQLLETAK